MSTAAVGHMLRYVKEGGTDTLAIVRYLDDQMPALNDVRKIVSEWRAGLERDARVEAHHAAIRTARVAG